jgi:hypothetical protein
MKRQWKIQRELKESLDGQSRWDQAYQLLAEIARSVDEDQRQALLEVSHASSDLCTSIHPTPSASPNH